jgi:phosphate starvation-inducible PhoH-like protein
MHILKNIKDLAMIQFDSHDIVRHKLVQRIVEAFDKAEKESAKRKQTPKTED